MVKVGYVTAVFAWLSAPHSPLDILTVNVCAAVSPFLQSTSCRPATSRNRKSGMFLRAVVTGPDKIERYRGREREGMLRKRKDSWPLTRPTPRVLFWRCPVWRGRSLDSCPPRATALPLQRCLPLSLCLCERTRDGHHTYTTAEIWPRLQTERLEEENFTTLSHLLFLYLLYGGRTHTDTMPHTPIHKYRHFDEQRLC